MAGLKQRIYDMVKTWCDKLLEYQIKEQDPLIYCEGVLGDLSEKRLYIIAEVGIYEKVR